MTNQNTIKGLIQKRVNIIKAALALDNIKQNEIAKELKITDTAVRNWIYYRSTSSDISEWFKKRFGEKFLTQIESI